MTTQSLLHSTTTTISDTNINMNATGGATATGVDLSGDLTTSSGSSPNPSPVSMFHWWRFGFLADYIVIAAIFGASFYASSLKPFERPFDPNDPELSHPHLKNFVTNTQLIIISVVFPFAAVCALTALRVSFGGFAGSGGRNGRSIVGGRLGRPGEGSYIKDSIAAGLREVHHFFVGLLLAGSVTKFVTDLTKKWAGRLRPDFLSRCSWNAATQLCTGDPALVTDGRQSFPSGHSSLSWTGCTFLALYLFAVFEVWPVISFSKGPLLPISMGYVHVTSHGSGTYPNTGRAWRFALAFAPLLVSTYVAISRTQQYVHHPTDVIAGGVLGIFIAWGVHLSRIPARLTVPVPDPDGADD
ncbi:hypothetical protein HDU76_009036 [Blyttiomyces sp. JEL0837]|nr:hypothetical protein HDU76_009036 [Blyttiomyces sp. JEL0837]